MLEKQPKKHALTPKMEAMKWEPGKTGNPNGRPKKGTAIADNMKSMK